MATAPEQAEQYPPPPKENRDLEHIPGDYGLPLLGHTLTFVTDPEKLSERLSRYGHIYRTSVFFQRVVVLLGADANEFVLADRGKNFSSYLGWARQLNPFFPRGLMLRDGDDHRHHRRLMQGAFRKDALAQYLQAMQPEIAAGLDGWKDSHELRFYPAIKALTLDLAARVFLGVPLGREAERVNRAFLDTVAASISVVRVPVPGLAFWRGRRGRAFLERFIRERIPAKRDSDDSDLFAQLCRATDESGEVYSDQEIVDHMIFLMMAAHDTTTSALTTMVYNLAKRPDWQERLREDSFALGKSQLEHGDLEQLERMSWVFRESLRLAPPLPTIPRRTVRDCEFRGYTIPANTAVSVSPSFTQHMEEYWTDPEAFDPERFSPERAEHKRHPFAWAPFGGGAHMCIGLHFAELQTKAIMHQLLQRFRITVPDGYEMRLQIVPIAKPRDGLPVHLEPLA